jgi:hypothetical protein
MNDEKRLIKEAIYFMAEKYVSAFSKFTFKESIATEKKFPTEQEVLELFSKLPFCIADEVIYFFLTINEVQKKYGNNLMILPEHSFVTLFPFWMIAPSEVYDIVDNYHAYHEYQHYGLDIIHGNDKILFFTPALSENKYESPIYYHWGMDDNNGILCYSSLTNLLLMVADCYENRAYYYRESIGWQEDFTKSKIIFNKYHPGLLFRSPRQLEHFLDY